MQYKHRIPSKHIKYKYAMSKKCVYMSEKLNLLSQTVA